jgi:thioredoxin-like negative regulator of GroEL
MALGRRSILIFLLVTWMGLGLGLPVRAQAPAGSKALPTILEFSRPGCPICQASERVVKAVQTEYPGQFEVRKYNIGEDASVFLRYKVALVPTQVFLDASGKEVDQHPGIFKPKELIDKLHKLKFIRE